MKKYSQTHQLYQRFLNNQSTSAELEQLLNDFGSIDEEELKNLIENALDEIKEDEIDEARAAHLANTAVTIMSKIEQTSLIEKPKVAPGFFKVKRATIFRIAASIILVISIGIFAKWYFVEKNEIRPGGSFATLIDGKGEHFDLTKDNALSAQCCVTITKATDGRIIYQSIPGEDKTASTLNKIVTPLGGRYKITLSDGSLVILNSGSSLEFPIGFKGAERRVKLTGEGYLEVTKDAAKPFIVVAGTKVVEVLGTKFNISSYDDDQFWSTTLLEGKIAFKDLKSTERVILKPGEQLSVEHGKTSLQEIDAEDAMAWKDGKFVFKNEDLATVMHKISRWYNVGVAYNNLPDRRLYAKVSMDASLNEVLRMISITTNLKFKVEERRIILVN